MIYILVQDTMGQQMEMMISHLLRNMPCPWCLKNSENTNERIELNTFTTLEIGVRCIICQAEIMDISTIDECKHCDS